MLKKSLTNKLRSYDSYPHEIYKQVPLKSGKEDIKQKQTYVMYITTV